MIYSTQQVAPKTISLDPKFHQIPQVHGLWEQVPPTFFMDLCNSHVELVN